MRPGSGEVSGRRPAVDEPPPGRAHALDPRLLRHDLGDEHLPRVLGVADQQRPPSRLCQRNRRLLKLRLLTVFTGPRIAASAQRPPRLAALESGSTQRGVLEGPCGSERHSGSTGRLAGPARRLPRRRARRLGLALDRRPPARRRGRPDRPEARGLGDAVGAGRPDRARPPRPARRRQHLPQPGPDRQARDDRRPPV